MSEARKKGAADFLQARRLKCNTCSMSQSNLDINELTPDERLELIEELWNSLSERQDALALTKAQTEELDRRIDEMDRDQSLGEPWQDVLKGIRERE